MNFEKLLTFDIVKFGKLAYFPNWKFMKFPEFQSLENSRILRIFSIWKTIKIPKIDKFWNCSSIQYSSPLAILPILVFALWYKLILILIIIFYFSDSRKFGLSTFEPSLISNSIRQPFENFTVQNFNPYPEINGNQ